jgi:tRNA dimethylallyltransferase
MEHTHPLENILAIVGPTASGKSAHSMALVEAAAKKNISIEIISMDSALVYRSMNIGTAKPTIEELSAIPHHGIDILDPWETYSAASFARDVTKWVKDIRGRGNYPVIVGGTMLYWRSLMQGLTNLPASTFEVREQIASQAKEIGWDALYRQLQEIDPITANRLPPGDTQRVSRALEVFALTGKPMSSYLAIAPYGASRDDAAFNHLLVSLEPNERSWLHQRIEQRFLQMLDRGFLDEVNHLLLNPKITPDLPSMRAVGYRQAIFYLRKETSYQGFVDAGIAASRQLAKRQLTWLRAMPSRRVVDPSSSDFINQSLTICLEHIHQFR